MPVVKNDEAGNKTKWCDQCKKRHPLDHEHFAAGGDRAANTVTGSKSAADLAEQAGRPKKSVQRIQIQKLEAQQLEEQRESLERRWGRRMRMTYGFAAKLLDDPKIALSDEETADMGQVHADMCMALGWVASGKIESIADVLMAHMTCIAGRSEWGQAMLEKLMGKKDDEEAQPARPSSPQAG